MAIQISELGDIAGKFDISNDEAERIAATVSDARGFEQVWDNEDWWTDENNSTHVDICESRYVESRSYH